MSETDEIKVWQTRSVKHKVASVLIMDGVSFSYTPDNGITFSAPGSYVKQLIRRLVDNYGVLKKPVINEIG